MPSHLHLTVVLPLLPLLPAQIYINGTLVGGSDALAAKMSDGSITSLLQSTPVDQSSQPLSGALPPTLAAAVNGAQQTQSQTGSSSKQAATAAAEVPPPELLQLLAVIREPAAGIPRVSARPRWATANSV